MIPEKIKRIYWFMEILPKLGLKDVLYVVYYRILLKSGILVNKFPFERLDIADQVFRKNIVKKNFPDEWKEKVLEKANKIVNGNLPYFSYHWIRQSVPPNWFNNPFNGKECREINKHWTRISDFNSATGDIKNLWEASRFTWTGILARAYAVSGNEKYLHTLNSWVNDWIERNPLNQGPNWKCGQEASIRVFNLLNVAQILAQTENPTDELVMIIRQHLKRIYLNIRYAIAQQNNHATSEAAALFIGGSWLAQVDRTRKEQYLTYAGKGRYVLENLVKRLVYDDGSFAQHSVNYHRLFMDTLCLIVFWTQKLNLRKLTEDFYVTAGKSFNWLLSMTDESGSCPNLGSNDGTLLQGNHSCDYLDFRPSLQTASVLLKGCMTFERGPWDEALYWYDIKRENINMFPFQRKSHVHKSGYVVMISTGSWALLRFPFYKFRPAHNDVFHFDLWVEGRNILFDSGSYSYNPDKNCQVPDLRSVHAHNTLSFDHKEQMPRLSRFLPGKWPEPIIIGSKIEDHEHFKVWEGSYVDYSGNYHFRKVKWDHDRWEIFDKFRGRAANIEIGFNFSKCEYLFENETNSLLLPWGRIGISQNAKPEVRKHMVSRYYMQSEEVFRLVISSKNNSEITTSISIAF